VWVSTINSTIKNAHFVHRSTDVVLRRGWFPYPAAVAGWLFCAIRLGPGRLDESVADKALRDWGVMSWMFWPKLSVDGLGAEPLVPNVIEESLCRTN